MGKPFGTICAQTKQETSSRFLRLLPAPGILGLLLGLLLAAMPLSGQQKVETMNDGSIITTRPDGTKHLALSNAVTSIKEWAFAWKQLTSVTISPSVTSIGDEAFRYNRLGEVILPAALYSQRGNAFNQNPAGLKFYDYNTKKPGNKGRYLGTN